MTFLLPVDWALTVQAAAPLTTTSSMLWPLTACALLAGLGFVFVALRQKDNQLQSQAAQLQTYQKVQQAKDKHLKTEMVTLKDQLRETKQELGAQRKKNHTHHAELRTAQQQLKDAQKRLHEALHQRPAFVEPQEKVAPVEPVPKPEPAAQRADKIEATVTPAVATPSQLALQAELEALRREQQAMQEALEVSRKAARTHKDALTRLRRKHEDLRRIDIISRSKVELLEDKLRGLGRQYYEAISEVAALKGEVRPPRPSEPKQDTAAPRKRAPRSAKQQPRDIRLDGEEDTTRPSMADATDAPMSVVIPDDPMLLN